MRFRGDFSQVQGGYLVYKSGLGFLFRVPEIPFLLRPKSQKCAIFAILEVPKVDSSGDSHLFSPFISIIFFFFSPHFLLFFLTFLFFLTIRETADRSMIRRTAAETFTCFLLSLLLFFFFFFFDDQTDSSSRDSQLFSPLIRIISHFSPFSFFFLLFVYWTDSRDTATSHLF